MVCKTKTGKTKTRNQYEISQHSRAGFRLICVCLMR